MGIDRVKEIMKNCRFCFMCRHACPTFLSTKLDSHTPRGYALMLSEISTGMRDWTVDFVRKFYQCSQCGLCREDCEFHWAEDDLVRHAREDIIEKNMEPEGVKNVLESIQAFGLPFGNRPSVESFFLPPTVHHPDVIYHPGCSTVYYHPEIIGSTQRLLDRCGMSWMRMENEGCCGMPLYDLGFAEEAKQQAKKTFDALVAIHPKIILTGCPHCLRNFQEIYPAWQMSFPEGIRVMHTIEFIQEKIRDRSLVFRQDLSLESVSYHDPCQLGRKLRIFDSPRAFIEQVTGQSPLEIFHNREKAECCGAGSIQFFIDPNLSQKVATMRMNRVIDEQSKTLVTACQNCKTVFQRVVQDKPFPVRVMDIVELADIASGGKI